MLNKAMTDAITTVAKQYNIEVAALMAVVDTESAGVPFWNVSGEDRPAIRFEGHYFYARLSGINLKTAVAAGLASKTVGGVKNPADYAARYRLLEKAKKIDLNAALESTSFGLGQVMGANWKSLGYSSVQEFVDSNDTVQGQIEAMVHFIKTNRLDQYLKTYNWAAFAKAYNGASYAKNAYDKKLAAAYSKYSTKPAGFVTIPVSDKVAMDKNEVKELQIMLRKAGYAVKVDGDFGNVTLTALLNFQKDNGLNIDGIYGPLTRQTLQDNFNGRKKTETTVGMSATAAAGVGSTLSDTASQILPIADGSMIIKCVCVAIMVVGLYFTIKGLTGKK